MLASMWNVDRDRPCLFDCALTVGHRSSRGPLSHRARRLEVTQTVGVGALEPVSGALPPGSPPVRRALILAAGIGQRMRPLTTDVPKCLVEVNGVPIVFRSLQVLASAGVTEAIIVVGHEAAQVRRRVGRNFAGIEIVYVDAPSFEP